MGAFDSLMDLSLLIASLLGIAALGVTGEMAYPLLVGVMCFAIVDTLRSSVLYPKRRCVYEESSFPS
jgi:hypothetical protein